MAASLNTMTAASVTKSSNWPRESCQFHAVRTGVPSERAKYWRRRDLLKGVKPCQSRVLIICSLKHEIKKKVAKYMLFVKNCETRFCEVVRGRNLQRRASRISLSHPFVSGRSRFSGILNVADGKRQNPQLPMTTISRSFRCCLLLTMRKSSGWPPLWRNASRNCCCVVAWAPQ